MNKVFVKRLIWRCEGLSCGSSLSLSQMRIICKDVSAETLYDVLHDTSYRSKWDTNMIDTYDIGKLTANADIGYYSCESS